MINRAILSVLGVLFVRGGTHRAEIAVAVAVPVVAVLVYVVLWFLGW